MSKDTLTNANNSAARLLAVQAVYQMISTEQDAQSLIPEYLAHRAGMEVDGQKMVPPDRSRLSSLWFPSRLFTAPVRKTKAPGFPGAFIAICRRN